MKTSGIFLEIGVPTFDVAVRFKDGTRGLFKVMSADTHRIAREFVLAELSHLEPVAVLAAIRPEERPQMAPVEAA